MSHTSIINLLPPPNPTSPPSTPISISLKLNNIILDHFNHCLAKSITPKLLVRNGEYFVKISDDLIFPCTKIPENLNFDIYSTNANDSGDFQGRIETKLNVLTDSKTIKQLSKLKVSPKPSSISTSASISLPASPKISITPSSASSASSQKLAHNDNHNNKKLSSSLIPFKINSHDSTSEITRKFLNLVALGPISEALIMETLDISEQTVDLVADLITNHCQIYNPNDSFIQDSRFPNQESDSIKYTEDDNQLSSLIPKYILKDKSYKDLKPWNWNFADFERELIINNINHSLTRLGYSETHPLRNKICLNPELLNNEGSNSSSSDEDNHHNHTTAHSKSHKKQSSLGGGLLISKSNGHKLLPFRKSQTESPKLSNLKKVSSNNGTSTNQTSSLGSPKPKASTSINSNTVTAGTTKSSTVKRKLSTSSSSSSASNSSDDERHNKRTKPDSYTSPSSEEIEDDTHLGHNNTNNNNTTASSASGTTASNSTSAAIASSRTTTPISASKKLDYYTSLAIKFKSKYKDYEALYNQLKSGSPIKNRLSSSTDNKKQLMKLLELHTTLAQWKKTLWDYNNQSIGKPALNSLSKHKKAHSLSPAILDNTQLFPPRPPSRQITPSIPHSSHSNTPSTSSKSSYHKHKQSLDY